MKYELKQTILIFGLKSTYKVLPVQNRKSAVHSNQYMYKVSSSTDNFDFLDLIRKEHFWAKVELVKIYNKISLSIKFHLKQTILIFWTKFDSNR